MRNRIAVLTAALGIPLAVTAVGWAAEQDQSIRSEPGIVLKDNKAAPGTLRVSKIIGTETFDPNGEDVGKIKDIVFDSSREQVAYIVLARAKGFAGQGGEKLVALPYKAMKYGSPAEDRVYVVLNNDILDKAPGFDNSKWPAQANADYYRSLDTYYKTQLAPGPDEPQASAQPGDEAQVASAQMGENGDMAWSQRASKLDGRGVMSPNGENLGKISDVVVDQKTGKVIYAAFEDHRGNRHAVPLSAFNLDINDKKLVLDTTREQLKQMPAFDEDRWPAEADPRWSRAKQESAQ